MIEQRDRVDLPPPAPPSINLDARAALAAEWQAAAPRTDAEIARFYQEARGLGDDLDAWHALPERQAWTDMLVHVAKESQALLIVDIGAGSGHDLLALRTALPSAELIGIEPNDHLRAKLGAYRLGSYRHGAYPAIDAAYRDTHAAAHVLGGADLLICIDVLEHVPDPETFLAGIAQRVRVGCLLFETTATHDVGTPLHLKANYGWHPGRCLEGHGWEVIDRAGRVRVWRRTAETGRERASLLLCAYRSVSAETMTAVFAVCAGNEVGYRLRVKSGDALISRSRSIILTAWYRETNDDVALMFDDDLTFTPAEADHLVELCRNGHDVIAGAYPVHNGGHLAIRYLPDTREVSFGPNQPPLEIMYAATGYVAIHRRVVDALIQTVPLCHGDQSWSFWPLFPSKVVENKAAGVHELLSEDWAFCDMARQAGFKIWLDPTIRLRHASTIPVSVHNMRDVYQAVGKA